MALSLHMSTFIGAGRIPLLTQRINQADTFLFGGSAVPCGAHSVKPSVLSYVSSSDFTVFFPALHLVSTPSKGSFPAYPLIPPLSVPQDAPDLAHCLPSPSQAGPGHRPVAPTMSDPQPTPDAALAGRRPSWWRTCWPLSDQPAGHGPAFCPRSSLAAQ